MEYVLAAALGFTGGVVGGTLGVGGGIIFVPALRSRLRRATARAPRQPRCWRSFRWRSSAPGASTPSATFAFATALLIGALSPIGVVAGVVLSNAVSQRLLEVAFAVLVLLVAAQLARRVIAPRRRPEAARAPPSSAPLTEASRALIRYSASASAEAKPPRLPLARPWAASGP